MEENKEQGNKMRTSIQTIQQHNMLQLQQGQETSDKEPEQEKIYEGLPHLGNMQHKNKLGKYKESKSLPHLGANQEGRQKWTAGNNQIK